MDFSYENEKEHISENELFWSDLIDYISINTLVGKFVLLNRE